MKKILPLAVAAALAAPAAVMADATMYGKLHLSIDYVDIDPYATWPPTAGAGIYLPSGHSGGNVFNAGEAYTEALAFGTFDPVSGDRVTEGVPEFQTAYDNAYQEAIDRGEPSERADVIGITAGIQAGEYNGTDEQLRAAVASALSAGAGAGYNGWDVTSRPGASRFGIKGSEDLGGGLKAIYQLEFGVDPADGSFSTRLRNSFVGLSSSWGTVLMGRHDTPLKISTGKLDMFADTAADYNFTVGFIDRRTSNTVAYISPSWSGFQLAGAVVSGCTAGSGCLFNEGSYTDIYTGLERENYADSLAEAWSIAAIYKNGPFYGSIAYESVGDKAIDGTLNVNEAFQALGYGTAKDWTMWRLGLGLLNWNGFTLSGVYENHSDVAGVSRDADMKLWQIQAAYAFGNNTIKAMYGQASPDECADPGNRGFWVWCRRGVGVSNTGQGLLDNDDKSTWAIGFDHNFSKRTRAYVLYTALDDDIDEGDWSSFSLGMQHSF